ncbi:pyruvate dehydrogenase (acetyl-transferring) E1 component subunit alpha [soil metagenome]
MIRVINLAWQMVKSAILFGGSYLLKGRRESVSAENSDNGDVEAREEGSVATDTDHLVDLYRDMVYVRTFEEACQKGFRQGKVGGYTHVYIGQEAVAAGFLDTHKEGDKVITAYRDHPHALLLGSDPKEVMAELYGRGTGLVKGKGGSMHLFDVENGMMGGYGIVGGHIPLGVGMAYAMRYQRTEHITQLYLGDGSMSQGAFHEAANLAGLWGKGGMCPVVFIVENNQYGMGTSVERTTAMTDLAAKFDAYGIENEKVDGMDVVAVLEAAERVTEQVRETGVSYAVEALTYRTAPHGAADFFEKYRTKEEVQEWRERDPIGLLEQKILDAESLDEDGLQEIKDEFKELIDEAVTFADESDEPPIEELYTDVYAGEDEYTGEA